MTVLSVTLGFENKKEQDFAEKFVPWAIFNREEGEYTDFDVTGDEPDSIAQVLDELMDAAMDEGIFEEEE